MEEYGQDCKVFTLSRDFTHHDCHAWSTIAFANYNVEPVKDGTFIIVADGFGNFGEVLSIYSVSKFGMPYVDKKCFGYGSSLGLFFQYATSYLGLKENQDEYKLLGYEAYVIDKERIDTLQRRAKTQAKKMYKVMSSTGTFLERYDPLIAVDALPALKLKYLKHFDRVLNSIDLTHKDDLETRRIYLAYYVQQVVEEVMLLVVAFIRPKQLLVAGGLFLNVKLNNKLSTLVDKLCIMPLAGDQGAALGLYQALNLDLRWPGHLNWGTRTFGLLDIKHQWNYTDPTKYIVRSEREALHIMIPLLKKDYIVNLIRGDMEFGSRALCNTSTLANPTKENVEYINKCNERSTIMPMAPVVRQEDAYLYFENIDKIHLSLRYMVCTLDYRRKPVDMMGAAHQYPYSDRYSGRPQIIRDSDKLMDELLINSKNHMLINTSFNEHGKPICYDLSDIKRCHEFQKGLDKQDRVRTIIMTT